MKSLQITGTGCAGSAILSVVLIGAVLVLSVWLEVLQGIAFAVVAALALGFAIWKEARRSAP